MANKILLSHLVVKGFIWFFVVVVTFHIFWCSKILYNGGTNCKAFSRCFVKNLFLLRWFKLFLFPHINDQHFLLITASFLMPYAFYIFCRKQRCTFHIIHWHAHFPVLWGRGGNISTWHVLSEAWLDFIVRFWSCLLSVEGGFITFYDMFFWQFVLFSVLVYGFLNFVHLLLSLSNN